MAPSGHRATAVFIDHWLDDLMGEREALLIRLAQVEDTLITYGRLRNRTKERGNSRPPALDISSRD